MYLSSQGSWTQKLIDRIYNVEKKRRRSESSSPRPAKRGRPCKLSRQYSRYPILEDSTQTDEELDSRTYRALILECARDKPRNDLLMQLMKDTCKLIFIIRN